VANIEIANTNSAISLHDNVITGVNNGYSTLLITSKRCPDILIVYNITVGYAPLTIASVQPSASKLNNYETLAWDITFAGGRPNYNVNFKVYRGTTVVVNSNRTETATGRISVNYQPTVAGTYLLEVTITSADGQSITQRSSATVVSNYTPVTVVPSTTASVTNRNLTWTTAYKGTSSVIRRDYTLFRDGSVVATEVGLNNLTFNYTPTVAGSYILRVIVYEANGNKIATPERPAFMLPFGLVCLDVLRHHPARRALVADIVPAAGPLQNGDGFALVHTEDDAVPGACTAAQRHADTRHRARTGRAGTSLRNRDGRRSDLNLVAVGFIHDFLESSFVLLQNPRCNNVDFLVVRQAGGVLRVSVQFAYDFVNRISQAAAHAQP